MFVTIDVLERVTDQTEWVNSFVIVEKLVDSSNPQALPFHPAEESYLIVHRSKGHENSLEMEPYHCRTIEELISMFSGAKV